VVTGKKNGARLVSVVVGSRDRLVRDQQAGQLLAKGFVDAPPGRAQAAVAQDGVHRNPGAPAADAQAPAGQKPEKGFDWGMIGVGLAGIAVGVLIGFAAASRNTSVRRT
jgi:D-alanyl-D-alanine carboxypeptidase (penicillin-binding protein 5/6)